MVEMVRSKPRGFRVPLLTIQEIRNLARTVCGILLLHAGCRSLKEMNWEEFIERTLPQKLQIEVDFIDDQDKTLAPGAPAGIMGNVLKLRDTCYRGICYGSRRDVFTLFHELGHYFLGHTRVFARAQVEEHSWDEDSETQANRFAAECLMPLDQITKYRLYTPDLIVRHFGNVSMDAARVRIRSLVRERAI